MATQSTLQYCIHNIHPFTHTFPHRRRCRPREATASSSAAVRVRCLAHSEETGVELATFRLPANLLCLLSPVPSDSLIQMSSSALSTRPSWMGACLPLKESHYSRVSGGGAERSIPLLGSFSRSVPLGCWGRLSLCPLECFWGGGALCGSCKAPFRLQPRGTDALIQSLFLNYTHRLFCNYK